MTSLFLEIKKGLSGLSDKELSELDILLWAEVNRRDPNYFAFDDEDTRSYDD